jgi:hypothetical protein
MEEIYLHSSACHHGVMFRHRQNFHYRGIRGGSEDNGEPASRLRFEPGALRLKSEPLAFHSGWSLTVDVHNVEQDDKMIIKFRPIYII